MKQAKIYMHNLPAGILTEDETGYSFCYEHQYLRMIDAEPVSLTLPLKEKA